MGGPRRRVASAALLLLACAATGMGIRAWRNRSPEGPQAAGRPVKLAASAWRSMLAGLLDEERGGLKARLSLVSDYFERRLSRWLGGRDPGGRAPEGRGVAREEVRPDRLPELSEESSSQRAARLWQGGALAMAQGDYGWAVRQFEGCLKAEPTDEACRLGLRDARRQSALNERSKARDRDRRRGRTGADGTR